MTSVDLSKYQKLSELDHIRLRAGIFIGSVYETRSVCWLYDNETDFMKQEEIEYSPGLLKIFDEIISNSVDEHIRSGKVNNIWVDLHPLTGEIVVRDDGGIPVAKHPEYDVYIPQMIFGELRTGSNFDDSERMTAGQNGYGVKLSNIFSKEFRVETCDGKQRYVQHFSDGMKNVSDPTISRSTIKGTTITFTPDYEYFKCSLNESNIRKIEKRVYDIAGCNPSIGVHLNGKQIKFKNFQAFAERFVESVVYDSNNDFDIAISGTPLDGFGHVTYVNGIDVFNGGTHVDYIVNQITNKIREFIKKKHRVDVKPNNIKQQMFLVARCRINAPMFNSQSKEFLTSDPKNYGTSYEPSDRFIKKVLDSDIVQKVLDWVEGEKRRAEMANLRKLNKTTQNTNFLKRITKFDDATSKERKECMLFLTEGNSAAKPILSARDAKIHGVFPLKGKPLNVRDIELSKLASNEEFQNIMSIVGLKIGHRVEDPSELRFGKVVILADSDVDGFHVSGLFFNMIHAFWPELFEYGVIYRLNAPIIIATMKGKEYEFFSQNEYNIWAESNPNHKKKYFKGLGTFDSKYFYRFLRDEATYMKKIVIEDSTDVDALNIAFDKSKADERKDWLLT